MQKPGIITVEARLCLITCSAGTQREPATGLKCVMTGIIHFKEGAKFYIIF
jgi:hypothetical protein